MSDTQYAIEWDHPIGPAKRTTHETYPWDKLPEPRVIVEVDEDGDEVERTSYASFFVAKEMKNPSAQIARTKERYVDWDFEWRRVAENMEVDEEIVEDGRVVGTKKVTKLVRGVRFWRTK
jgi:hypothetical protein